MKRAILFLTVVLAIVTTSCGSSQGHPESTEIEVTNGGTTEKCKLISADYLSREGYGCRTFFHAMLIDGRPTALSGTAEYSIMIKCSKYPNELKEGDELIEDYIDYYNYMAQGNGRAYSKKGSITVLKKSNDKITLKFDNFNFTTTPCSEEFGINGTITYHLDKK